MNEEAIPEEETIVFRMQAEIDDLKHLVRQYHQYILDIAPHSYLEGNHAKHLRERRALLLGEES